MIKWLKKKLKVGVIKADIKELKADAKYLKADIKRIYRYDGYNPNSRHPSLEGLAAQIRTLTAHRDASEKRMNMLMDHLGIQFTTSKPVPAITQVVLKDAQS